LNTHGPASIFNDDTYDQVLFHGLYNRLKRLKQADPIMTEKSLEDIKAWFKHRRQKSQLAEKEKTELA
jgi:hypothetical protein